MTGRDKHWYQAGIAVGVIIGVTVTGAMFVLAGSVIAACCGLR